jgi:uncharacterized paraquat-inducible protein A
MNSTYQCPLCGMALDSPNGTCPRCPTRTDTTDEASGSRAGLALVVLIVVGGIAGTTLKLAGPL